MNNPLSISFDSNGLNFSHIPIDQISSVGEEKIAVLDFYGFSELVHQWLELTKYKSWISDMTFEEDDSHYWLILSLKDSVPYRFDVCISEIREKFYRRFSNIIITESNKRIAFNRTPMVAIIK